MIHFLLLQKMFWDWTHYSVLNAQLLWGIQWTHSLVRNSHESLWGTRIHVGCMGNMRLDLRILDVCVLTVYPQMWVLILPPSHVWRNKHARTMWERSLDEGSLLGETATVRLLWKIGGKTQSALHRLSRVPHEIIALGIEGENSVFSVPVSFFTLRKPNIPVILYCQCSRGEKCHVYLRNSTGWTR